MNWLICNGFSKHSFHNSLSLAVGMCGLDEHRELFLEGVCRFPVCGRWLSKDVAMCVGWDSVFLGVGSFALAVALVGVDVLFGIVFIFRTLSLTRDLCGLDPTRCRWAVDWLLVEGRLEDGQKVVPGLRQALVRGRWLSEDVALCLGWVNGLCAAVSLGELVLYTLVDVNVVFGIVVIFFVVIGVLVGQLIGLGAAISLGELILWV